MADRGIIFSAPMVRALLDGRKTQTRRFASFIKPDGDGFHIRGNGGGMLGADDDAVRVYGPDYAPYAPGDRLYVREAFSYDTLDVDRDGTLPPWYWADGNIADAGQGSGNFTKPKPSIHMPRWASRLWLSVTDVRVQRVQEISEADADAEGFGGDYPTNVLPDVFPGEPDDWGHLTLPECYGHLWNSLHTKPGERWEDDPWIVAITFDVHHGNIDTVSSDAPEIAGARATEPSERGE